MNITEISSAQNSRYKVWCKLLDAKGIKKYQEAIMAGRKVLEEMLHQYPHAISGIIVQSSDELEALPIPAMCPVYHVSAELFARLDIYGTKSPLLLITAPPPPVWDGALHAGLTIFLPFQNPINLGTTIRTAAALGARVVVLQEAASPYLPKSLRASGPAIFQVGLSQGASIYDLAQYASLPIFGLSLQGQNIFRFDFPLTLGLVAGMEGPGLEDFWPQAQRLTIPMSEGVESLNAAIAMGMAIACHATQYAK